MKEQGNLKMCWFQWTCTCLYLLLMVHSSNTLPARSKKMTLTHAWKTLEFDVPSIKNKDFIHNAAIPFDVDVYEKDDESRKIFITIPRLQSVVRIPVTIGYVTNKNSSDGDPIIAPYPNLEWNTPGGDCSGITSVYRVKVDTCKRIWILDTGKVGNYQVCPPQILSFSLENDSLLLKYKFPSNQYQNSSLFVTPVIDIAENEKHEPVCEDTHVYIADSTASALLVYNVRANKSWRIVNKRFGPNADFTDFLIYVDEPENFKIAEGITGMALRPAKNGGDKTLLFHALSDVVEKWVQTSAIKNEGLLRNNPEVKIDEIQDRRRQSQSAAEDMDKNGVLFFGQMSEVAIGCLDTKTHPNYDNEIFDKTIIDPETLQYTSGVKVVPSKNGKENLWVLSNSFQKYKRGSLRHDEINFRIQFAPTDYLVRGTTCE